MKYMKNIPDKYFELAIVDPPYGINAPNMNMGSGRGYISTSERLRKGRLNSGGGKLKDRALQKNGYRMGLQDAFSSIFQRAI